MNETKAYIERIKRVNRDYQQLELAVDPSLTNMHAGQAVLARFMDNDYEIEQWDPYLRELWFPVEIIAENKIIVERPAKVQYIPGQLLSLIGPIGQPFRFRRSLRNILLMVYHTPPSSLLMMLKPLLANQVSHIMGLPEC